MMALASLLQASPAPSPARPPEARRPANDAPTSPALANGYRYVLRIAQRAVDSRGRIRDEPHFGGVARTRGLLVRVDFDAPTRRQQRADWYVTRDGGRNVTFVDEQRQLVAELPVATMGDKVMAQRRIRLTLTDMDLSWTPVRDCGQLGAWRTRCLTLQVRYRAHAALSLARDVTDVTESIEYRFIPGMDDLVLPYESFYGTRLDLLAHRDPQFAAAWRRAQQRRPSGSVVQVTVERRESQQHLHTTIRRTIGIDSLARATHPTSLYDIPPGLRLADR